MINECLHVNNYFANTNLARQGETNYIAELTIPSCTDHPSFIYQNTNHFPRRYIKVKLLGFDFFIFYLDLD